MRAWWVLLLLLSACEWSAFTTDGGVTPRALTTDGGAGPIDGIVFVHGINDSGEGWAVMRQRFLDEGWPADRLLAETFEDPSWGCNALNADTVHRWVSTLEARGATRIAIVAHSMGGLSARHFLKQLGGTSRVAVFTTLGTMHHGLSKPCSAPLAICVWDELCATGAFIEALNAAPATPGPTRWTSVFSDTDATVPASSAQLDGATNVLVPGLAHDGPHGLQDDETVFLRVRESLR